MVRCLDGAEREAHELEGDPVGPEALEDGPVWGEEGLEGGVRERVEEVERAGEGEVAGLRGDLVVGEDVPEGVVEVRFEGVGYGDVVFRVAVVVVVGDGGGG